MRASKKLIEQVWEKADEIRGRDPEVWRKDAEGNRIRHGSYGTVGEYGWEIDHKNPVSKGGTDNIRNLQPLGCRVAGNALRLSHLLGVEFLFQLRVRNGQNGL